MQKLKWFTIEEKLPKEKMRCLAYVTIIYSQNESWKGYLDVFYDPHVGWKHCNSYIFNNNVFIKPLDIYVHQWIPISQIDVSKLKGDIF